MRNYDIEDEYDVENAKNLNLEDWHIELLKINPDYPYWGPHEDYMIQNGSGWDSSLEFKSWEEFGPFELDDYNEIVNFYFEMTRKSQDCPDCKGGYSEYAKSLEDKWFGRGNEEWVYIDSGRRYNKNAWQYNLSQVEVDALYEEGRLSGYSEKPTAEQINESYKGGMGHDCINRMICIKARCEADGERYTCSTCEGKGYEYIEDIPKVTLVLWLLHPRKGASRGIEVHNITQEDLPKIFEFLNTARERNDQRFSKIDKLKGS